MSFRYQRGGKSGNMPNMDLDLSQPPGFHSNMDNLFYPPPPQQPIVQQMPKDDQESIILKLSKKGQKNVLGKITLYPCPDATAKQPKFRGVFKSGMYQFDIGLWERKGKDGNIECYSGPVSI